MAPSVAVIGSINRDRVLQVERLPNGGETVMAVEGSTHRGGKGANQSIAAARHGAHTALVGCIGVDSEGAAYLRTLAGEGVDVSGVSTDPDLPTGEAWITVDAEGENTIVVAAGANSRLTTRHVEAAASTIAAADVLLAQLEVPMDAVAAAIASAQGTVVLDPAPAMRVPPHVLASVDVLIPNRTELAQLAGLDASTPDSFDDVDAAGRLLDLVAAVVVTVGSAGAVVVTRDAAPLRVPAPQVAAIDTTGAGDAFAGALAARLGAGAPLPDAVRYAVTAASIATTRIGAQSAMPRTADVVALLE